MAYIPQPKDITNFLGSSTSPRTYSNESMFRGPTLPSQQSFSANQQSDSLNSMSPQTTQQMPMMPQTTQQMPMMPQMNPMLQMLMQKHPMLGGMLSNHALFR